MSRRIVIAPGETYHVYNRGVDKRTIFLDAADQEYFLALLYIANNTEPSPLSEILSRYSYKELFSLPKKDLLVAVGAYCLMPNHIHLLLHEKTEGGISRFMHKLSTAYTMYFNSKYNRSGSLFQGTFKVSHADHDQYLKYLFAYIHLNPVKVIDEDGWGRRRFTNKKKDLDYLRAYTSSSYLDYVGKKRPETDILSQEYFPKYFHNSVDFEKMIKVWMSSDGIL